MLLVLNKLTLNDNLIGIILLHKKVDINILHKSMAYRYPPPPIVKLTGTRVSPQLAQVVNFNIPPPGYKSAHTVETWKPDVYNICPPPPSLPALAPLSPFQELSVHHTLGSCHVNEAKSEVVGLPECLTRKQSDVLWMKEWLQKRRKPGVHLNEKPPIPLKMCEIRHSLQLCLTNLEELYILQKELKIKCYDVEATFWRQKWDQIMEVKIQIDYSLRKLYNPDMLNGMKTALMKSNKRCSKKKWQYDLYQEVARESHTRRQQLHQNIDTWLKNMQKLVEETKREESLKHEADQVLAEVTRRKTEARRQINMLAALQKLRQIRAHAAINRGQHLDTESENRFTRVTEHLQKLWKEQLKEYDVEEQGLQVMLDEAVVERTKSEVSQDKKLLAEWEVLLFGRREAYNNFYKMAEKDVKSFVALRHSWDKFVVFLAAVMSSSIPVGWVLPSNPSSEKWNSLLTENNNKHFKL